MTTINSSVFSGLSGANQALISRAVELINNQSLTSLEPLRQALSSGSLTVRLATAADEVPAGVHATFRDPQIDPQTGAVVKQGEVLIRAEYVNTNRDATLLQFIDDLNHEGIGHGTRVDSRADLRENLLLNPAGLSTTARGDAYVKGWIDDEASARYTAYAFRKELATLGTEYSASNRAILATDDTFKEFARLEAVANGMGLAGADKVDYVIAQARPVVAAYNSHFYRDSASQYVIDALHLNSTEGAAYDAHVKATFNSLGYEVTDVVMHDDNSSSASVIYENGDRREVVFDSSGALYEENRTGANGDVVTTRYDTSGNIASITETDGAHDNADYATRVTAYDSQGRIDYTDVHHDDGTRDRVDNDQAGIQNWAHVDSHYDAQGREDWRVATLDDGSRDWTDFDQSNARGDSIWAGHFDAQGREDWRSVTLDDGSKDWTDFDQSSSEAWTRQEMHYDGLGRLDSSTVFEDNGSRDRTDFDQDGSQSWSRIESHYDAQGREDNAYVLFDNGQRNTYDYDQDGSQGWSLIESHYDAQGREDNAYVLFDDGQRNTYDFDQDGSQGWSQIESHYDAQGREDNAYVLFDDGQRNTYDFDQDGSQGWSRIEAHYDAQGREDTAAVFMDDGRHTSYNYDESGANDWRVIINHYGTNGQLMDAYKEADNGTYVNYFFGPSGQLEAVSDVDISGVHHWMDKYPNNDYTIVDAGLADDGITYFYGGPPEEEGEIWW